MRRILFVLIILLPAITFGQYQEKINTDRVGNTLSPFTVGKSVIQVQGGYNFSQLKREGTAGFSFDGDRFSTKILATSHLNNTNFKIRYGLGEKIELFAILGDLQSKTSLDDMDPSSSNSRLLGFGYRMNLYEGKGAIPAIGFEVNASFVDEADFIHFSLALSNKLGQRFEMGASAQWFVEGSYFFTARPQFRISERIAAIAEYELRFGSIQPFIFYPVDGPHHFASGGFLIHISDNFAFDFLAGGLLTAPENLGLKEYFQIQGGLSYRLDWTD